MATRTITTLVDDMDGGEAEETVPFGLDGVDYEIDLNKDHADELREALEKFVAAARSIRGAGRKLPPRARQAPPAPKHTELPRKWTVEERKSMSDYAVSIGRRPVSARGRISQATVDAWVAAGKPARS